MVVGKNKMKHRGDVFRGVSRNWYKGFSSKYDAITPSVAELYAIREGLAMEVGYDIQNLKLETDVEILVKLLRNLDDTYHHELSPVLNDVACLMSKFRSIEFTHIPRGSNKVAHCLAQYAFCMAIGHKMFLNPPPFARISNPQKELPEINKETTIEGQNAQGVIDIEAATTSVSSPHTVTKQILFGTIPTIVTTSVKILKKTERDIKGKNVVNEQQQLKE